jgi:hypothetical protein
MPFPTDSIADDAPDAALRWAWNYRYRYLAAGFRGPFRITDHQGRAQRRGLRAGSSSCPCRECHGAGEDRNQRFAAGGRFGEAELARGLSWRQYQPTEAEKDYKVTDEVFVYLPEMRKVRRAPPQSAEGVYVPSFTRANSVANIGMTLPDASATDVGNTAIGATEPLRKGFVGFLIRPNAYKWTWAACAMCSRPRTRVGLSARTPPATSA